ncbi:zinc-ribbon domain-containing protein [Gordonibacter pamelaeae]|uniref:zinc-ribbon domain-containing protein n=1 Tax=Gordonibacter pamelaeae TaxID=471189 RepID=UPI003C6DB407
MCFRPAAVTLDKTCPKCGETNDPSAEICSACGANLPITQAFPGASGASGAPEVPGAFGNAGKPGAPAAPNSPAPPKTPDASELQR